jgi:hypothetical protein
MTKLIKRDENGLIEGVEYKFKADGTVDWRGMISPEFLIINKEYEKEIVMRYNRDINKINPLEVEDRYLLILLGGIKQVLRLRGYRSVKQEVNYVDGYKCVNTCTIEFIPNFETGGEAVTFSDTASASLDSTSGTFKLFIETIAANRAFVRAVRNGLGINIVGKDEFDDRANKKFAKVEELMKTPEVSEVSGFTPNRLLAAKCVDLGYTFTQIKDRALTLNSAESSENVKFESDPSAWASFDSIPHPDAYTMLNRLKAKEETKKKKV